MGAVLLHPAAAAPSEVMVVATMHGLHAKSATYSYDMLYGLVRSAKPDFVGVEIRAEDLPREADYLKRNYPAEMIAVAGEWGARAFGFDWLGEDVAGAPVPADWWKVRSPLKALERALDGETTFKSEAMEKARDDEMKVLANATAASLNDGRYDEINDRYYAAFRDMVRGTKYQGLTDFYAERDRRIDDNIIAFIRAHPGARIVILTGADHRGPLLRSLKATFGDTIRLLPVP